MTHPSRRWSGEWGIPAEPPMPEVDVLIPTIERPAELAVTLAGLAAQDEPPFRVVVSDQSDDAHSIAAPAVQAMARVLRVQGRPVELVQHLPRRGLAEHRQYLLDRASAEFVLFLDDDVWLEPASIERMLRAIRALGCGFVGLAVQGLSYLGDDRPHERTSFEAWQGAVTPERMRVDAPGFARASLHSAANLVHLAAGLEVPREGWLPYRIAWLGGCVLYGRQVLIESGGFQFWRELPEAHAGEDVAAQWRVMERFGAAGILPSGAVHLESPTTVPDRSVEARDRLFTAG